MFALTEGDFVWPSCCQLGLYSSHPLQVMACLGPGGGVEAIRFADSGIQGERARVPDLSRCDSLLPAGRRMKPQARNLSRQGPKPPVP